MTRSEREPPEDQGAALLDEVLRSERALLFPPGTLVASLVVPCFAIGAILLAMAAALSIARGVPAIVGSIAAAVVLTGVTTVGHVLVVFGRARHRAWLRSYVRSLLACIAASALAVTLVKAPGPWPLLLIAGVSFAACDRLLSSRAYLGFASFQALKRRRRELGS
jgi:hypothetical protein